MQHDPTPDPGAAPIVAQVAAIERATRDIRIVRLRTDRPFPFAAGQYASVTFDGQPPRDYSIASGPDEPLLEFHIRDSGAGPSHYVATTLTVGDRVALRGPFGRSTLASAGDGPLAAIAGGSGLAPMKALVEAALAADPARAVRLYFGARDVPDLYLLEHFRALEDRCAGFVYRPALSEPSGAHGYATGLVGDVAAADLPEPAHWTVYLAGPPGMVAHAAEALAARGVPEGAIRGDSFWGDAEMARRQAAAGLPRHERLPEPDATAGPARHASGPR